MKEFYHIYEFQLKHYHLLVSNYYRNFNRAGNILKSLEEEVAELQRQSQERDKKIEEQRRELARLYMIQQELSDDPMNNLVLLNGLSPTSNERCVNGVRSPFEQYPAAPKSPFKQYQAAPRSPFKHYPAAPRSPFEQYTAAPKSPFEQYPAAPRSPLEQYAAAPRSPFEQYSAAPKSPFEQYPGAPKSPFEQCPVITPRSPNYFDI